MSITKKKQIQRYKKQINGYQQEQRGEGGNLTAPTYIMLYINLTSIKGKRGKKIAYSKS